MVQCQKRKGDSGLNVLILHGPNLNRLGKRETSIYGCTTLDELNQRLMKLGRKWDMEIAFAQKNGEGELIELIHEAEGKYDFVIFNPGAYTHYSYALRDAIASVEVPVIEVHLSNVYAREAFREKSVIASECVGQVTGFGLLSYELALTAIRSRIQDDQKGKEYAEANW